MEPMIASLLRPQAYDHPVRHVQLLETHLSWILLTGTWAYKIRKPVNLGFVDLTSADARRHCALEELRLNRRLCPDLYVGLREIHGPPERATLHPPAQPGLGPAAIEVAVQMLQFQQQDLLPARLRDRRPDPALWLDLADRLAAFHGKAAVARPEDPWAEPSRVLEPALANLAVLAGLNPPPAELEALAGWTRAEHSRLEPLLRQRKATGRIREGHGDLHLGNLVVRHGRIDAFDCLEFCPALRWIDVISDLAFLVMDLQRHGEASTGTAVLNRWLQASGDYGGLRLWRWLVVYRALVRAKVSALRQLQQRQAGEDPALHAQAMEDYLALAQQTSRLGPGPLVITHGVSGTGKSWLSDRLCRRLGWIHLRSDVERLRLFGRWGEPPPGGILQDDPYGQEITDRLYGQVIPDAAAAAISAGFGVIVDATFLQHGQRSKLKQLASAWGCRFLILDLQGQACRAPERIRSRLERGGDPSEADLAVLDRQVQHQQPLTASERADALVVAPTKEPIHERCVDGLAGEVGSRLASGSLSG